MFHHGIQIEQRPAHAGHAEAVREIGERVGSNRAHGTRREERVRKLPSVAGPNGAAARTAQWRQQGRTPALLHFITKSRDLRWSPALLRLLIEEMYVEEDFSALLGPPEQIPRRYYAQAVAVALVLRHSWRQDDLEQIAHRILKPRATP